MARPQRHTIVTGDNLLDPHSIIASDRDDLSARYHHAVHNQIHVVLHRPVQLDQRTWRYLENLPNRHARPA